MPEFEELKNKLVQAMSSEHASYGSTKKFLSKLPTDGRYVIQGPGENAGILDLGDNWGLALRIESHNHPSYVKPYNGAATGVGGILRDIFTMGARPIGLLDFLRFGADDHGRYLMREVVNGIADYGNCVGVPVIGGDIFFDPTYKNNCLVNVACLGVVKKTNIIYGNALTGGSDLIYVGGRTGRDGVGGAQMASDVLDIPNEAAVQDADPFLEKLLVEACCELAETNWIEGMQDMGGAGLLCSTTEVVLRGRKKTGLSLGSEVWLDKIPTKAPNLTPLEFLLSESQERMLIVGKRPNRENILNLFSHWDLEATVCGQVTEDGLYTLIFEEGGFKKQAKMSFDEIIPEVQQDWPLKKWKPQNSLYTDADSSTKRSIWTQYDWMVGRRTLKGPDLKGNYAILNLPEIEKQLVVSWSSDEGRSNLNPKSGINYAFRKCLSRLEEQKAVPLGLTNCLNFGHPKDSMGAFSQTIDALAQNSLKHNIPVVSGNVSLYNAHREHSIKPTPVLVMVGLR